jgi:hypothetical protein
MNINKLNRGSDTNEYKYLQITAEQFSEFVRRPPYIRCMEPEDNSLMAKNYLIIRLLGRLF